MAVGSTGRIAGWFRADPRRAVAVVATAIVLALFAYQLAYAFAYPDRIDFKPGADLTLYRDAASRWLGGSSFYLPRQLVGPYTIAEGDRLYPPPTLLLFVPFVYLPAFLWWAIPLGLTAWAIVRLRPSPLIWPVLGLCLAWPVTAVKIVAGNPVMWSMAGIACGTLYYWPAPFAGLKLTLGPFALFGIWRRSWWLGLGGLACLSALFLPMWPDYLRSVLNENNPAGPLYSIGEAPMMALPILAWLASPRGPRLAWPSRRPREKAADST